MPHKQIGQFFLAFVIDADCVQVTILKSIVASCKLRFMFLILVLWMLFEGEKKVLDQQRSVVQNDEHYSTSELLCFLVHISRCFFDCVGVYKFQLQNCINSNKMY